jgi:hypothetical protein
MLVKKGRISGTDASATFAGLVQRHFTFHLQAYGSSLLRPKHHFLLHLPRQMASDNMVIDAFPCERLHLQVKRAAEPIKNTRTYEFSVLAAVTHVHSNTAYKPSQLCAPTAQAGEFGGCDVSNSLTSNGTAISVGDVVFDGDQPGQVLACVSQQGRLYVIVDVFELSRRISKHSAHWRPGCGRQVWDAASCACALAWKRAASTTLIIMM